jgi:prevent-host-death family protein
MKTIGAFDAKTHFSEILKEVENGGQIVITKHGRAVAKLIPMQTKCTESILTAIQDLKDFSKNHTLGELFWKALRDEAKK